MFISADYAHLPWRTVPGKNAQGYSTTDNRHINHKSEIIKCLKLKSRAHAVDKLGNRYYDPTTKTNEDGTFEVTHIRPGEHFIQVEPFWLNAEDAPPQSSVVVEVTEGEIEEGIELMVGEK